jgi:hypothetical protein
MSYEELKSKRPEGGAHVYCITDLAPSGAKT